jgi:hypothetical protein
MAFTKRLKDLFAEPGYRTKLLVFFLIGLVLVLSSILAKDPFWRDLLLQIAITFVTVAFVQVLWGFLGGDPVEVQIKTTEVEIEKHTQRLLDNLDQRIFAVDDKIGTLKNSLNLLADLIDGNIGIERIWPDRRAWREDPDAGLKKWQEWVCQAKEVYIVSNTLWNNWMHDEKFRQQLFANLSRGAKVKIVVYHPKSPLLANRVKDEGDPRSFGVQQMQSEIVSSLKVIVMMLRSAAESVRQNFEVRLMHDFMLLSQLVRADDRMVLAIYLSGKTGGPSPTIQLKGEQSIYFMKYVEQFNIVWERSQPVEWHDLNKLVEQFQESTIPAQEP